MKVLDDTAKEQINETIKNIQLICNMYYDCPDGCPFCIINEKTKIPRCMFSSIPEHWDTIK